MAKNLYFFHGEESFLIEDKVKAFSDTNNTHTKERFSGKFEIQTLFDAISTVSLFNESKLILIETPWFLSSAVSDKEAKQLIELFDAIGQTDHIVMIYVLGKKVDKRKKMVAQLIKRANTIEFHSFKDWEQDKVLGWIKSRIQAREKTIQKEALAWLEQIGANNLRHLASEIEKLIVYIGQRDHISLDDVHAVSAGNSANIFQLTEAFKENRREDAIKATSILLDNGEDPIKLAGLIISNVRLYYQILILSKQGLSAPEMAKQLGKNPYYLKRLIPALTRSFSVQKLKAAYAILNQNDIDIKSGKVQPKIGLELSLLKILGTA